MARRNREFAVTLYRVQALNNTRAGNPRFKLFTDAGEFITQSNASCAYDIPNISESLPVDVTIRVTPEYRVWSIQVVDRKEVTA